MNTDYAAAQQGKINGTQRRKDIKNGMPLQQKIIPG
jgi:hypothetical protein